MSVSYCTPWQKSDAPAVLSANVHHVLCSQFPFILHILKLLTIGTPITNNLCIRWTVGITKNLCRNKCHPQNDDMFSLPAAFAMSLVEVWQSWQTHRFLKIWSGAPGSLLNSDEPICNGQFLTMVTWLKDLLHIMQNKWISLVWGWSSHM